MQSYRVCRVWRVLRVGQVGRAMPSRPLEKTDFVPKMENKLFRLCNNGRIKLPKLQIYSSEIEQSCSDFEQCTDLTRGITRSTRSTSKASRTDSHAYRAHLPRSQHVIYFPQRYILLSAHGHNSLHINMLCVVCSAYSHAFLTHGMSCVWRVERFVRVVVDIGGASVWRCAPWCIGVAGCP